MYSRACCMVGMLSLMLAEVPAQGGTATLRLEASQGSIAPGQQMVVEAFIDNLPVDLHGYQIGLSITGGDSGEITAALISDPSLVDEDHPNWVFRELADANVTILTAGTGVAPPRLLALPLSVDEGFLPSEERYLGTFVLEASGDASGIFEIGITPPDIEDTSAATILVTTGVSAFPADVDDPAVIPVSSNALAVGVDSAPLTATLRLEASEGSLVPGQQIVIDAFIDNLPIELYAYQIGLDVTGGISGEIVPALINDAVMVDEDHPNWVFREIADEGENILTAGAALVPPRLFALPINPNATVQPAEERYLGTFVLQASEDAFGDFQIGITPTDIADSTVWTALMTTGGDLFEADVDDPALIPISAMDLSISVQRHYLRNSGTIDRIKRPMMQSGPVQP